ADGAVPVFHRAYDGGAGEVAQVIPMMKALQEIATSRRMLIIGGACREICVTEYVEFPLRPVESG
ncbi:hypothetical protein, partial [Micromonospora sp. ALFpr18c]|uniref:hypothetical protein n=1 Tax=Micromonospora sp. ALFpr18c TaxID=1458665 RepID=UPI001CEDD4EE